MQTFKRHMRLTGFMPCPEAPSCKYPIVDALISKTRPLMIFGPRTSNTGHLDPVGCKAFQTSARIGGQLALSEMEVASCAVAGIQLMCLGAEGLLPKTDF